MPLILAAAFGQRCGEWLRGPMENKMIEKEKLLTSKNIITFIIECGTTLDERNLTELGRWMTLPRWAIGLLYTTDIKNFLMDGLVFPFVDGQIGRIDRFELFQKDSDQGLVRFGTIYYPELTYYQTVKQGEKPPSRFDEWNW